jgi:hypothetical protein
MTIACETGASIKTRLVFDRWRLLTFGLVVATDGWCVGHTAVVKALVRAGADVAVKNKLGLSALQLARDYKKLSIVRFLSLQSELAAKL